MKMEFKSLTLFRLSNTIESYRCKKINELLRKVEELKGATLEEIARGGFCLEIGDPGFKEAFMVGKICGEDGKIWMSAHDDGWQVYTGLVREYSDETVYEAFKGDSLES
jgi:hypothetical protein